MTIALLVLAVVALAAAGYLAVRLQRLDARERALRADLALVEPAPPTADRVAAQLITIEILNPFELARARNRYARVAGAVAPSLVRGLVYDQAAKALREQLAEQGVQADVQVLGAGR